MNNKRRKLLKQAAELLDRASGLLSCALDGEEDALDAIPENLQSSERYEKIEAAVDNLSDAADDIDAAVEKIKDAMR